MPTADKYIKVIQEPWEVLKRRGEKKSERAKCDSRDGIQRTCLGFQSYKKVVIPFKTLAKQTERLWQNKETSIIAETIKIICLRQLALKNKDHLK